MDRIDLSILELLGQNGRTSYHTMSKSINLTRPAINRRIKIMEKKGIIKGYKVIINWEKIGYNFDAYVLAKVSTDNFRELIKKILAVKDPNFKILTCSRVTGEKSILIRIVAKEANNLNEFHDKLLEMKEIHETKTLIILDAIKGDNEIFYKADPI